MKDTYSAKYECTNCEFVGPIKIEKGKTKPAKAECPICGCETCRPHAELPRTTYQPYPVIIREPHCLPPVHWSDHTTIDTTPKPMFEVTCRN